MTQTPEGRAVWERKKAKARRAARRLKREASEFQGKFERQKITRRQAARDAIKNAQTNGGFQ